MSLTRFTDYSLRVLMYAAAQPERHVTIAEIAAAYAISESHLKKVVHHLGKAGLLTNVRGRGGGVGLARPAARINLGAVVRVSEADCALVECFDAKNNRCVITPACPVRTLFAQALDAFYAVLDRHTLADLMRNRARLQSLLKIS